MSTEATQTTDELERIERRLKAMAEKCWNPLRQEADSNPMEVWRAEQDVRIGYVNDLSSNFLRDDVIREFDDDYYEFTMLPDSERGCSIAVSPSSEQDYYAVPDAADVRRAAVIEALDETDIHVPQVGGSHGDWLKHFETREEAERVASILEEPIDRHHKQMWGDGVERLEVREFEDFREWLNPDPYYAIIVHFE